MPPPLAIAAALAPQVFRGITGLFQKKKAKKGLAELQRPKYEIPGSAKRSLAMAQMAYADPTLPGQQTMLDRADVATANALEAARISGRGVEAVSGIHAGQQKAYQDVGFAAAQQQERDLQRLMQAEQQFAQREDMKWQMNEFAPYADKYNELREMYGAGQQNLYRGLDVMGAIGINMLSPTQPATTGITPQQASGIVNQYLGNQAVTSTLSSITPGPITLPPRGLPQGAGGGGFDPLDPSNFINYIL